MSVIKWFSCSTQIRSSDYAGKTYNSNDYYYLFFSNEIWENKRQEKDKAKTVMSFFAKYVSYQIFFKS